MKIKWLAVLVLSLLCWTSTNIASHYNAVKSEDKIIYAIFKNRFTEPIEIIYYLMNDMRLFKVVSNDENRVSFSLQLLKNEFKQSGYEISDIIVIIHNHKILAYFSHSDIVVYKLFRGEGFEGKFCIYVWRTKTIYELAKRLR